MAHLVHDDLGSGPPLVLLHAYPLDGRLFDEQRHVLSRVARVLIPDLRGFGRSSRLQPAETLEEHAADIAGMLDHLAIGTATLCGVSMGGYLALAFLERFRDRVAGLVLANTRSQADTDEQRATRLATAERAEAVGIDAVIQGLPEKMLHPVTQRDCPDITLRLAGLMNEQPAAGVAAAQRAMAARPDRTRLLAEAGVPTLVIAGDADPLIPRADTDAMAKALPGGKPVIIADTAHLSNLERPAPFNEAVIRFVTGG
jgi:pimeloyl-ACP methyl ester carboxylesterase